jgi:diacylglycerol kinase (ATP)
MYYYIINPSAGNGAINRVQEKMKSRLSELGIDGEFAKTTGPGDATKMAKMAITRGYSTIIAVGGDGTVNEIINGITKDSVAVGIIPIGNANNIAEHFGIGNWQQACQVLAARRLTSYALISAGQEFFLSSLNIGFQLDEKNEIPAGQPSLAGKFDRFRNNWKRAKDFMPLACIINVDNQYVLESPLYRLTIANQRFENPLATNKLVLTIFQKPAGQTLPNYILKAVRKRHDASTTTTIKATYVVIETQPPTEVAVDSKPAGQTPISIRLTDRRIRFITEKQPH